MLRRRHCLQRITIVVGCRLLMLLLGLDTGWDLNTRRCLLRLRLQLSLFLDGLLFVFPLDFLIRFLIAPLPGPFTCFV